MRQPILKPHEFGYYARWLRLVQVDCIDRFMQGKRISISRPLFSVGLVTGNDFSRALLQST